LVLKEAETFLTNILMKAITVATFAKRMAGSADSLSCQRLQLGLDLRSHVLVKGTVWADLKLTKF
jgi:hypothetical protein